MLILTKDALISCFFLNGCEILLATGRRKCIITLVRTTKAVIGVIISVFLVCVKTNILFMGTITANMCVLHLMLIGVCMGQGCPTLSFCTRPGRNTLGRGGTTLLRRIINVVMGGASAAILAVYLKTGSLLRIDMCKVCVVIIGTIGRLVASFSGNLATKFKRIVTGGRRRALGGDCSDCRCVCFMVVFVIVTYVKILVLPFIKMCAVGLASMRCMHPILKVLFALVIFVRGMEVPKLAVVYTTKRCGRAECRTVLRTIVGVAISLKLM